MNRDVAKLAQRPRGLKWRSRLIPYDADIKRMRRAGASFQTIAKWICEQGLSISGSAVHAYVRVRVRVGHVGYQLLAVQCMDLAADGLGDKYLLDLGSSGVDNTSGNAALLTNEYVYKGPRREDGLSADENLSFGNTLD